MARNGLAVGLVVERQPFLVESDADASWSRSRRRRSCRALSALHDDSAATRRSARVATRAGHRAPAMCEIEQYVWNESAMARSACATSIPSPSIANSSRALQHATRRRRPPLGVDAHVEPRRPACGASRDTRRRRSRSTPRARRASCRPGRGPSSPAASIVTAGPPGRPISYRRSPRHVACTVVDVGRGSPSAGAPGARPVSVDRHRATARRACGAAWTCANG